MRGIRLVRRISILLMVCCSFAGCGKKEAETAEEGASSYIYVPDRLATDSGGGCGLPEGFRRPVVGEEYLYFLQENQSVQSIGKALLSGENGTVELAEAESLFVISTSGMEMGGEEGYEPSEEEISELQDRAMEEGMEKENEPQGQAVRMDPKKTYISFFLKDYGVDQEGNLYLAVECSMGGYFQMTSVGCLVCRRTQEGQWEYRSFLPGMELVQEGGAVDGRGGVYLLTEEGITVIDAAGQKTGMIRTDRYKGNLFFGENYSVIRMDMSIISYMRISASSGKGSG